MALRLRYWIGLVVLGCSLATLALIPRSTEYLLGSRPWRSLYGQSFSRADSLRREIRSAHEWVARLELRDSLLPLVERASADSTAGPLLLISAGLEPGLRSEIDSTFTEALRKVAELQREARIAVAVVLDTAPRVPGASTSRFDGVTHFFPEATDGRTCLAVLTIRQLPGYGRAWWWFRPPRRHPEDVVGPCVYYAAFGEPGGQIKRWLESRQYSPAAYPGWAFSQDHGRVVLFDTDSEFLYVTSLLYFSPGFVVCAAGHREPCRDALLWQAEGPGAEPAPAGVFEVGVRDRHYPLAGTDYYLLSDALLDMGRERFARFWSSELSVEEAFATAMGVPLEEWVMRWARSHVDPQAFDRGAPTSSCLLALLVAGACLAAGVWWGSRREVA